MVERQKTTVTEGLLKSGIYSTTQVEDAAPERGRFLRAHSSFVLPEMQPLRFHCSRCPLC